MTGTREIPSELRGSSFGQDFAWGAATAAYQIEGAWNADGKGPSIWDEFSRKGKIRNRDRGDEACDHYHRFAQDVALMRELGLGAYRFSISWPRLLPEGTLSGGVNRKGLDFYRRLAEALLEAGIKPWATLYHWDLPLALEQRGGWASRDIVNWFSDYAALCVRELGDLIPNWIVLNEPFIFLLLGYGIGYHAPSRRGLRRFLRASHYTLLAQGRAARAMQAEKSGLHLGTTVSTLAGYPASDSPKDLAALASHDAFFNRLYVDPVFGRGYPAGELPMLRGVDRYVEANDLQEIQFPFQFLGINHYSRKIVRRAWWMPYLRFRELRPAKTAVKTAMGWEIHPEGLFQILQKFGSYGEIPALYITENGAAFPDVVSSDGKVHDPERIRYLEGYLTQALRAKNEGVNLKGYFVWSLLDNLEWREGFAKRFGIIHVDFETKKRTPKDSAAWYAAMIRR